MGFLATCLIFCLELYGAITSSGKEDEKEKKRTAQETFDSSVNANRNSNASVITEDLEDLTRSLIEDK